MKKLFLDLLVVSSFIGACLCINVSVAHAEDEVMKTSYVSIKGGAFIPNKDGGANDSDGGLVNFDSGYNFEASYGFRFNKYFALETGLGVYLTDTKETVRTSYSATNARIVVVPMTVSALVFLPLQKVDFFAGAGFGYYSAAYRTETSSAYGNVSTDDTAGAFGYQVLGGIDFNFTPRFAIGGEVKYVQAKPEFTFPMSTNIKVNVGGTIINGGVKFRF